MEQVLLVGATGLVGKALLQQLLDDDRIQRIYAPTRTALPAHTKLINPVGSDLEQLLQQLTEPVTTLFCCLGTTQKEAGGRKNFYFVDYELPLLAGKTGLRLGAHCCAVVSAIGANAHSSYFYSKVKGEMEQGLQAQGWQTLIIARPSMLLGERDKPRWLEKLGGLLFTILPGRWRAIPAVDVAQAMWYCTVQPQTEAVHIVESDELSRLAAEKSSTYR